MVRCVGLLEGRTACYAYELSRAMICFCRINRADGSAAIQAVAMSAAEAL
jgi:hypothetical protein